MIQEIPKEIKASLYQLGEEKKIPEIYLHKVLFLWQNADTRVSSNEAKKLLPELKKALSEYAQGRHPTRIIPDSKLIKIVNFHLSDYGRLNALKVLPDVRRPEERYAFKYQPAVLRAMLREKFKIKLVEKKSKAKGGGLWKYRDHWRHI